MGKQETIKTLNELIEAINSMDGELFFNEYGDSLDADYITALLEAISCLESQEKKQ